MNIIRFYHRGNMFLRAAPGLVIDNSVTMATDIMNQNILTKDQKIKSVIATDLLLH